MIATLNQSPTTALQRLSRPTVASTLPEPSSDKVTLSPESQGLSGRMSGLKATALALGLAATLSLSGCATTFSDGFSTTTIGVTPGGGSYIYTTPNYNYNYYSPRCGYNYDFWGNSYYGCY
ncbi:MAG: hypothetical protein AMXMBFR33_37210 [Candidatus Xenobia bacterium]